MSKRAIAARVLSPAALLQVVCNRPRLTILVKLFSPNWCRFRPYSMVAAHTAVQNLSHRKVFFLTRPTAYDTQSSSVGWRASTGARLAYWCSHVKPFGIENQLVVRADRAVPCIAGRSVSEQETKVADEFDRG
jgi:hypothetical protein